MPPAAQERFIEDRKLTFIHSTNAIEGNTLTLQETKHVLELYKQYPQIFDREKGATVMKIRQVSVFIENEPGRLYEITKMLGDHGLNIRALSLADTTDFGIIRFIVTEPERAYKVLKEHGFTVGSNEVLAITIPDVPGSLADILELFKRQGINVEYMYAFVNNAIGGGKEAVMVFRFGNIDHALNELQTAGFRVLSEDEIFKI